MLDTKVLLSDQVDAREIALVLRELDRTRGVAGDIVEFGCYVGTTSVFLGTQREKGKQLFLYDSFEGLPEKGLQDISPVGQQFVAGELAATKKQLLSNLKRAGVHDARVKKAWFSDLTDVDVPESISFAFLDGDYYDSILIPLQLIWERLSPGAIVIVDDYANEALPGAARAVDTWLHRHDASLHIEHSLAIMRLP